MRRELVVMIYGKFNNLFINGETVMEDHLI